MKVSVVKCERAQHFELPRTQVPARTPARLIILAVTRSVQAGILAQVRLVQFCYNPTMEYLGNDIYCDLILKGGTPVKKIYESPAVLAFHHTEAVASIHVVVIPKKHILSLATIYDLGDEEREELVAVVADLSKKIEKEYGAARVVTNLGDYQESRHLHFHIISNYRQ